MPDNTATAESLLELNPTPAAPSKGSAAPKPGDNHRAMILECRTLDDLERVAGTFNADTLVGKMFRSLPKAAADDIRHLWRGVRCSLVWSRVWRSVCEAIARPPVTPAPVAATPAPSGEIVSILSRVAQETRQPARAVPFSVPRARLASPAATEVRRMRSGDLIAGALAHGQGALVSWTRGRAGYRAARNGACSREELLAALGTVAATHLAPPAPSAAKQFGESMRTLNSQGLVTRHATRKMGEAIPPDVESRFIVGYVDASADLGSLGDKRLIADLTTGGNLRFTGSDTLADRVRRDYESRVAGDTYTGTDLAAWLERTLRGAYHAVSCGAHLYVPASHVATVRSLVGAVRSLMGRSFQVIPVTTGDDLIAGLADSLSDEVAAIRERFDRETERARGDNRTAIGPRMAATMLRECLDVRERVTGYGAMLGDSAVSAVRVDLGALETVLRGLCDDTSERFAALDLN